MLRNTVNNNNNNKDDTSSLASDEAIIPNHQRSPPKSLFSRTRRATAKLTTNDVSPSKSKTSSLQRKKEKSIFSRTTRSSSTTTTSTSTSTTITSALPWILLCIMTLFGIMEIVFLANLFSNNNNNNNNPQYYYHQSDFGNGLGWFSWASHLSFFTTTSTITSPPVVPERGPPIPNHPDMAEPAAAVQSSSSSNRYLQDKEPILEIMRQAGMDMSSISKQHDANDADAIADDTILEQLPTWTKVTELYGNTPQIIGLDRCQEFRDSTDPVNRFFGVSGTFNSGTNLIAELLIQNCQITERMMAVGNKSKGVRWQVPWGKHYPAYRRTSHLTRTDKDVPIENSLPIVVIRDPYQWAQSMCRHPYAAQWNHTNHHCPNIVPTQDDRRKFAKHLLPNQTYMPVKVRYAEDFKTHHESLFHMWTEWYQLYLNATYPRIMVRFEDLLFHGKEITQAVCACGGGVEREDRPPGFRHVRESAKLGTAAHGKFKTNLVGALIKYGTDEHRIDQMTPADLQAAKEILDPQVMNAFGYFHPR